MYYNLYNNNGYSALGPVWQEPEPSHVTGMPLIRCILYEFLGVFYILLTVHHVMILGKWPTWCTHSFLCITLLIYQEFLGVVCHCFPPRLDFPTFAARCLHVLNDVSDPSNEMWNYGREMSGNFAYMTSLFTPLGIFYMSQIYDMGPTALLPIRRKACWGFFRP
jgi:hypothetical protein